MAEASPFWTRRVHADRRPLLVARGRIAAAVRACFAARDFVEVETAILQASPGNEAHLHAFAAELVAPDGQRVPRYLRTSPEFACKKLLAAGERRIFEFARSFRNREQSALHHPEFTLVEWYRADEPYGVLMEDCAALLAAASEAAGTKRLVFRERIATPFAEPERMTVAQAFERFAKIDLLATVRGHETDRDALAAWARKSPADPRVAERFELYACGVELANAFGELTDAEEQRRRFAAEMALKARLHGERYPVDEDFLAALAGMPQACGIALGFDRLVMLLTGAARIDEVLWTPVG